MAEKRTRRRFTAEFKAQAVRRLLDGGKGLGEVATELGLSPGQLSEPASAERTPGQGASRGPGHLLVGLGRGQEAEAGMPAPAVVEGFHILEDRPPGRLPRREGRAVDELVLQAAEEALHRRVIEAIALAAHGLRDP